jgi:hypothetical protein
MEFDSGLDLGLEYIIIACLITIFLLFLLVDKKRIIERGPEFDLDNINNIENMSDLYRDDNNMLYKYKLVEINCLE